MKGLPEPNPADDEQAVAIDPALEAWAQTHLAIVRPQTTAKLESDLAFELGLRVGRERFAHEETRRRRAIAVLSSLAGMAAMGLLTMLLPHLATPPETGSGDHLVRMAPMSEDGADSVEALHQPSSLRWERLVKQVFESPLSRDLGHNESNGEPNSDLPSPSLLKPVDYRRELGLRWETNNES